VAPKISSASTSLAAMSAPLQIYLVALSIGSCGNLPVIPRIG